jgi:Uma2 family endonuclease
MIQSLSKPTKTILELEPTVNVWVNATWDEFVSFGERAEFVKSKAFYFNGQMRIETMGVGADHARDNSILALVVSLFCITMGISIESFTNVSYRKPGFQEIQPDLSYYVGDGQVPTGSSIVNLTDYPVPDLAIEIADSSLSEDLGKKRLLYEALGIAEYWVIDVAQAQVVGFQIQSQGSHQIRESIVLPGLSFSILEQALVMSRSQNHTAVGIWLMQQFQR